jgi:type VI secretion system protein ImpM
MKQSGQPAAMAPGFFGKLPARGDFLARRVPTGVSAAWEEWLASLVTAAKVALGNRWPDDWLTAPLWHFVLGSAIAPPSGAMGVLLASVDRVGRFFPFSIIGTGAAGMDADRGADEWARSVEALALDSLGENFDPETLDTALGTLGAPPAVHGVVQVTGQWSLKFENDWPSPSVGALAASALQAPGPDQSTWWCRGSDRVEPLHLRCTGLPNPATAAAMITGAFSLPGDLLT